MLRPTGSPEATRNGGGKNAEGCLNGFPPKAGALYGVERDLLQRSAVRLRLFSWRSLLRKLSVHLLRGVVSESSCCEMRRLSLRWWSIVLRAVCDKLDALTDGVNAWPENPGSSMSTR